MVSFQASKIGFVGALALVLTGCMGTKHAVGVQQIDGLVGRVERIHLDAELSRERVQDAVEAVRAIVRGEFTGDASEAFEQFVVAIERSEAQVDRIRQSVDPMQERAVEVYEAWSEDLASFTSPTLRARSEERRNLAGERYARVLYAIQPTLDQLDAYNRILRDHALFLSYDLNASSVVELEPELELLRDDAEVLDETIDQLLRAAGDFVRATAPLGKVTLSGEAITAR
ncbi:hypothetical protein Pla163_33010 [Planctomycetes bacterium Pla163]|uniref:DUF2959 domain-containing protein n=1 Tax=Rohdeia mirabilis TaxID=2528008 RepID=A0A518D3T9_9BACT|nr:hypothetical protein Pla163_33010 [Planctomycetes bacterium Pla163]